MSSNTEPDLSPLLPDESTLKARRAALVDAVGSAGPPGRRPSSARRGRGPRLALGGAVAVVAAVAALIVGAGGDTTPKAFAVEARDGGGVAIEVYSAEDAAGLEAAFSAVGVRSQVTWLPEGMACREPRFKQSEVKSALGGTIGGLAGGGPAPAMTIGVMTFDQLREIQDEYNRGEISEGEFHTLTPNIALDPTSIRPDQTVVISGAPGPYYGHPEGGYEFRFGIAEGPVEPCEPVPAPEHGSLEETNRMLRAEAAERGVE